MPHMQEEPTFSAPAEVLQLSGLVIVLHVTPVHCDTNASQLFDMDGTVIDSTDAIVKHWHEYATSVVFMKEQLLMTVGLVRS